MTMFFLRRRESTMGQPRPGVAKRDDHCAAISPSTMVKKKKETEGRNLSPQKNPKTHMRESTSHEGYTLH